MTKITVHCKNLNTYIDVPGGSTLLELARTLEPVLGFRPICAHVNNKTEGLDYAVYMPKQVNFLSAARGSGQRVYIRSLCMLLFRAVTAVLPGHTLRIRHSVARGYYCTLHDSRGEQIHPDNKTLDDLRNYMQRLVTADAPFQRCERLTDDVLEMFRAEGLDDKCRLLETLHQLYTTYHVLDGVADSYYGALAPSTGYITVFDLVKYKEGFLLMGPDRENADIPAQPITQEKMFDAFRDYLEFNSIVGVADVGQLNQVVLRRQTSDLINLAEALHSQYLGRISDQIAQRYRQGGARIVLVAGPSSSGKTTTAKRLAIQLMTRLLKPKTISLDNYFVDRTHTPLDADGDYDYESLYALDLEQFNRDLTDILAGKEVKMPTYDFETGTRRYKGDTLRLEDGGILVIEGIHGLNPELTAHIPEFQKYRVYVSALTTLSIDDHNWVPTTDNRLLRRIIRDYKYRGTSAADTIRRWPSVRRGEEKWIFPYQENADSTFNSSLIFELGVMRDLGDKILRDVHSDIPEYAEAYRLRKFLSYFLPIGQELVPPTSLLREFLGGSSFHY